MKEIGKDAAHQEAVEGTKQPSNTVTFEEIMQDITEADSPKIN